MQFDVTGPAAELLFALGLQPGTYVCGWPVGIVVGVVFWWLFLRRPVGRSGRRIGRNAHRAYRRGR